MITQQYLQDNFDYNQNTGLFVRTKKTGNSTKIGVPLTCNKGNGYVVFSVQGKLQLAHRMAWLYIYGEIPSKNIDHINGLPTDNRISNLRIADQSQNTANSCLSKANTSGSKGVVWLKDAGKWRAGITVNYKFINLGRFENIDDAIQAYEAGSRKYFGNFASNGIRS
jgi:hypothetical protein